MIARFVKALALLVLSIPALLGFVRATEAKDAPLAELDRATLSALTDPPRDAKPGDLSFRRDLAVERRAMATTPDRILVSAELSLGDFGGSRGQALLSVSRPLGIATTVQPLLRASGEPPRLCGRLHFLRGWGHDKTGEVLPGGEGAGGSDGVRAERGPRVSVGGDPFDFREDRVVGVGESIFNRLGRNV